MKGMLASSHVPALLQETVQALSVQPGGRYIDGTLGGGGHTAAILECASPGGQVMGIDADPDALKVARARLSAYEDSVMLANDNFVNLRAVSMKYDFFPVHGILLDLGLSSLQLENGRGFSFQHDAPLDMRFSPDQRTTAADIVNSASEAELARIIWTYGEERLSRQIARRVVAERPFSTTLQLAGAVERAVGGRTGRLHPATRTFQALRIVVNNELSNLESALGQAVELLGFQGRLVVISYHSLEDRVVKQFMRREAMGCICPPGVMKCVCGHTPRLRLVNRRSITPSPEEIELNARARSARLRAAERILPQDCSSPVPDPGMVAAANSAGWRRSVLLKRIRVAYVAAMIGARA